MNCRDIERLLAEGRPLTAEAKKHIAECPGCRSLLVALDSGAALGSISTRVGPALVLPPLTPVKPLASDAVLISLTMASFVVFCLVVAAFVGLGGFARLTLAERFAYYGSVTFFGLLLSIASVQSVIPGAKVRVPRSLILAGAIVILPALTLALFPHFDLERFVTRGVPCLRFGCICAALFGALAALALRRGYITDVRATSLLLGSFAGFSGVAVLSLHCPILNAPHIIVWHFGAIAISALAGSLLGWFIPRRS